MTTRETEQSWSDDLVWGTVLVVGQRPAASTADALAAAGYLALVTSLDAVDGVLDHVQVDLVVVIDELSALETRRLDTRDVMCVRAEGTAGEALRKLVDRCLLGAEPTRLAA